MKSDSNEASGTETTRVLLIEDNPGDVAIIRALLAADESGCFAVTSFSRLDEAETALESGASDVILLDLSLPDSHGLETVARVRRSAGDVPILVLTGMDDVETGAATIREGAEEFLSKAWLGEANHLTRAIRHAIERQTLKSALTLQIERLSSSEARFRRIIERNADAILLLDGDGIVRSANPPAEKLLGRPAERLIGKPLDFPLVTEEEIVIERDDKTVALAEVGVVETEWEGERQSIATLRDLTSRKQVEAELRRSNRLLKETLGELEAAQQKALVDERLKALGQMASGVAHDFNNMLTPIRGYTDLLLSTAHPCEDERKLLRYLRSIRSAAEDAARIVRRLREFYRHRARDEVHGEVDLNEVVRAAVELTAFSWRDAARAKGATIEIDTDLADTPLALSGNEAEIRVVLTNLILNATDAMPGGGRIEIRTRAEGDRVLLRVSDSGTGMSDEVRERCLEPFFSTKGEHGTGMGLAMVHGIARRHGGSLSIESRVGVGTTVEFGFPTCQGPAAGAGREEPGGTGSALRVLLVDDEEAIRDVVGALLSASGHEVTTAASGLDGLELFSRGWFDIVVTDQAMPDMSGENFATLIRQSAPEKPIVLLTGFGDMMNAAEERPEAIDLVIGKPISQADLQAALTTAMAMRCK